MSEPHKNHIGPWIAALLIGLPVLYVVSFGPACWWFSKAEFPEVNLDYTTDSEDLFELWPHAPRAYWPLGWLAAHGPRPVGHLLFWYATAGGRQPVALPCERQGSSRVYPP